MISCSTAIKIYIRLRLEGVDVTRDVEVEVVLLDLLDGAR